MTSDQPVKVGLAERELPRYYKISKMLVYFL